MPRETDRRTFLRRSFEASCGYGAALLFAPLSARRAYGQAVHGEVLKREPFARLERLAEGVWSLVSTPFTPDGKSGDLTTHSNGGIVIGDTGVLAIDSYRTAKGGRFVAEACQLLAGRPPTHVVNTHFHFDHLGGTRGFFDHGVGPKVIMTQTTRELAYKAYLETSPSKDDPRFAISGVEKWGGNFTDASLIIENEAEPLTLDLGGRTVTLIPLRGHTGSDVVVRDDKTGITFAGDLIWDGIFPNFMSASPVAWQRSVARVIDLAGDLIVPGHGGVVTTRSNSLRVYQALLRAIEEHARESHAKGLSVRAAAQKMELPASLGDWQYFREGFHETAMDCWYQQLGLG